MLPTAVNWEAAALGELEDINDVVDLQSFLKLAPWTFEHRGGTHFVGVTMAWHVVLAFMIYMRVRPTLDDEGSLSYFELTNLVTQFRDYLRELARSYQYPGVGPSMKYAVASSREAYLYSVVAYEAPLTNLLSAVQRLVSFAT